MKRILGSFLLILLLNTIVEAQKIKYKDLFYLIETGNYKDSDPLLKAYIKDPKNVDDANANLQMAYLYEREVAATDVLFDSEKLVMYADSALYYYDQALKYIDEKEVTKKNEEYYQAFQRRDIRTGKFGVKLADVQFDIENRSKALEDKKSKVQELQIYYTKTKSTYQKVVGDFKEIKADYPSQTILYLQSNDSLLDRIEELKVNANIAQQNFGYYEATLKKIDKPGYAPARHMADIVDYKKDGESVADITSDNVDFWDFEKWVDAFKEGVKEVIVPLRTELIEYDQSLNALEERIMTDSLAMADRIKPMDGVLSKLREFDDDPMPEHLFKYKVADIKRKSNLMEHLYFRDSSDIVYQLNVASADYKYLNEQDSLINILIGRNLVEDSKNYESYINSQYKNLEGLQKYLKSSLDLTISEKKRSEELQSKLKERSKWLIGTSDSIPVFSEVNVGLSKYVPLVINDELTAGLYFSGRKPAEGYFALITNSRTQDMKVNFKVDNEHFKKQNLDLINTMLAADEEGHFYYVMYYIQLPEQEQYAASICKIYTSDGLAWEKDIKLDTTPKELLINNNTGDIIIEYDMENYLGDAEISDRLVLDKKGAIK